MHSLCKLSTDFIQDEHSAPRLFLDQQSASSFFRRPDFASDGSFFILPAASYQPNPNQKALNCALLYLRKNPGKPALVLPTQSPALLVSINPHTFSI